MKSKKNKTKIDEIEKLKKEQRTTRIIGIICLLFGIIVCEGVMFLDFHPIFAVLAGIVGLVGGVMTVRSFAHSKFSVLKDEPKQPVRAPERSFQTSDHPQNLLMTSHKMVTTTTVVAPQKIQASDSEETDEKDTLATAVATLRREIIDTITRNPATKYHLFSLLYQDAANCFPTGCSFQWDGAWFKLNLLTRELSAEVSTYPDQFGASREDVYPLSAQRFNRIVKQYNMSSKLIAFQTDEDWDKLFDDTLNAAVSAACTALQKQNEIRNAEEARQYAVRIPVSYRNLLPDMDITAVNIKLMQRYANTSVKIFNENGKYQMIAYTLHSFVSSKYDKQFSRELSIPEAVWLEKQIVNTVNNPDNSTWHSLPGGDRMHIAIKRENGESVFLENVEPIRKYSNLLQELEHLAQYGSLSDA